MEGRSPWLQRRKLGGVEMTGVSHGQVWQSRKPNNLCAWGEKGKSETTTPEVDERSHFLGRRKQMPIGPRWALTAVQSTQLL